MNTTTQDMSTPEAREAYYHHCWSVAAEAGNKARRALAWAIQKLGTYSHPDECGLNTGHCKCGYQEARNVLFGVSPPPPGPEEPKPGAPASTGQHGPSGAPSRRGPSLESIKEAVVEEEKPTLHPFSLLAALAGAGLVNRRGERVVRFGSALGRYTDPVAEYYSELENGCGAGHKPDGTQASGLTWFDLFHPTAPPDFHNPDGLTAEQVGDGFRLLVREPGSLGESLAYHESGFEVWSPFHKSWGPGRPEGYSSGQTYRVRLADHPLPEVPAQECPTPARQGIPVEHFLGCLVRPDGVPCSVPECPECEKLRKPAPATKEAKTPVPFERFVLYSGPRDGRFLSGGLQWSDEEPRWKNHLYEDDIGVYALPEHKAIAVPETPAEEPVSHIRNSVCLSCNGSGRDLDDSCMECDGNGAVHKPAREGTPAEKGGGFDFRSHLQRQREWSEKTFGPEFRTLGIIDHITQELAEIAKDPLDLTEWIDVVILALDGAWRAGHTPEAIIAALVAKQAKNEARKWPDWRTMPADKAINHDRTGEDPQGVVPPAGAKKSYYTVTIKGVEIDVYDILNAYGVTNPAAQHGIKKGLRSGNGHKTTAQDYSESAWSFTRAAEIESQPK